MMTPLDKDEFSRIEQEAAEWVLKTDRGLTAQEQDELTDWLSESEAHKEAYSLHRWGWDELDRLAGLHTSHKIPTDRDLLDPGNKRPAWRNPLTWTLPLAASLVLFLGIALFRYSDNTVEPKATDQIVYERIQQMQLEDGSHIELNHGATVRARYTDNERAVDLIEGEANFDIASDPDRPFVVYVSGLRLKALGTVFNVRYQSDTVDLIVTEGRVQLLEESDHEAGEATPAPRSVIETSQRAIVSMRPDAMEVIVRELDATEIQEELLWRPELIDFNDEYLPVIVENFNRRNRVQILLDDPSLNELKLTSIFWSDNVEAFVRLLESNFNVRVDRRNEREIILYVDARSTRES